MMNAAVLKYTLSISMVSMVLINDLIETYFSIFFIDI